MELIELGRCCAPPDGCVERIVYDAIVDAVKGHGVVHNSLSYSPYMNNESERIEAFATSEHQVNQFITNVMRSVMSKAWVIRRCENPFGHEHHDVGASGRFMFRGRLTALCKGCTEDAGLLKDVSTQGA
jgi:hypothetical protein